MFNPHFDYAEVPLAFFITFRTFGTWLHGDRRRSMDRFHNKFGTPKLPPDPFRASYEQSLMSRKPVLLDRRQRDIVEEGIRGLCLNRQWRLWALNARTNHVHVVVTANCDSKSVRAALKAQATKSMRENGCWQSKETPWSRKGSRRKVWNSKQLQRVIEYVTYEQE